MKEMIALFSRLTLYIALPVLFSACGGGGTSGQIISIQPIFGVSSISPAEYETGVALNTTIQLGFSEDVHLPTVIMQASDGACSGSVQISADDFVNCSGGTITTNTSSSFDITGLTLSPSTTYKVKVTTAVTNLAGTPLSPEYVMSSGFTTQYRHTVTIDGVNDFTASETFSSSTPGYSGYVAWDDTYLYLGMSGLDIASSSSNKHVVCYISGATGTNTGFTLNSQTPSLPFSAAYVLTYRLDTLSTKLYSWDGSSWVDTGYVPTGSASLSGSFMEIRLPVASLGSPSTMSMHLSIVDDTSAAEITYAGIPSSSFTDGYNPAYSKYFNFDLTASTLPSNYTALP